MERTGDRRKGPAVARHLPRDEEILRIAARVFSEFGIGGTRLDDIAREAGIAIGSLYHYFESKQQIVERLFQQIQALPLADDVDAAGESIEERFAHMVARRARILVSFPVEMDILIRHLMAMSDEMGEWARQTSARDVETLAATIAEGTRAGTFRTDDALRAAHLVTGALSRIPQWYRPGGDHSPDDVVQSTVAFSLAAVGIDTDRAQALARATAADTADAPS